MTITKQHIHMYRLIYVAMYVNYAPISMLVHRSFYRFYSELVVFQRFDCTQYIIM